MIGLEEMASALINWRAHLCLLDFCRHVFDILATIKKVADFGNTLEPSTARESPDPLGAKEAKVLLRQFSN